MPRKIIEGEPSRAKITEIHPFSEIGGEGNLPIGFIDYNDGSRGWYPLPRNRKFYPGQPVVVIERTWKVGRKGGSHTRYRIIPESI